MGDMFREILNIEQPATPELTKESLLSKKKVNYEKLDAENIFCLQFLLTKCLIFRTKSKRPEGMHREVFALLYKDSKDAPPLMPTDTGEKTH
jgi:DNA methyltransferase 1-associated protein 1